MGIDWALLCLETGQHRTVSRVSDVALQEFPPGGRRDADWLFYDARPLPMRPPVYLVTSETFDDGRLRAALEHYQSDVRLDRWSEDEAWCAVRWRAGYHVVAFPDNADGAQLLRSVTDRKRALAQITG